MEKILAGRYQVVQNIGRGGFGQTFLARDLYLPGHSFCVVKLLRPKVNHRSVLETAKRLFDREAKILHKLGSHEQIPQLYASFEQEGNFYLVQEFIEGQTLKQEIVPGKKFGETYVIELLYKILQVLSFVHRQNVIHRDIKPANLIRRKKDGKIVLIDFGAVKEVTNLAANLGEHTSFTVAIGSPGYMPPEQQASKPHFCSDIYAVGIIGIQALTGLSPNTIQPDIRSGEIHCTSFENIVAITPELGEILDRMLCYDYRQRYRTAIEAMEAIEKLFLKPSQSVLTEPTILSKSNPIETDSSPSKDVKTPTLSPKFIKLFQKELTLHIGPFAGFMVNELLEVNPQISAKELLEALAVEIPKQAVISLEKFIDRELELETSDDSSDFLESESNEPQNQSDSLENREEISALNPEFIECCRQKLAFYVGPFASLMIDELLHEHPQINAKELVDALTAEILDTEKANEFKRGLLSAWI